MKLHNTTAATAIFAFSLGVAMDLRSRGEFTVKLKTSLDKIAKTEVAHRSRRELIIKCCGRKSCYPDAKTSGRAYAKFRNDELKVSCPGCPLGWEDKLDWLADDSSKIPVTCEDCPAGWRTMADIDAISEIVSAKKTTEADVEEVTTESNSETSSDENSNEENLSIEEK